MPKLTLADGFQRFRRFVIALSGAHIQTLDRVPSERAKFESLGWAILITSGMAAVSMWFALSSAMGLNGVVAVVPAVAWGLVIMGIDRWLVTSMPADGPRKFLMAMPRFLLALLLGTLISTPFVLRVFEPEINAQIAVMQQNGYNNFLKQQQASDVAKQVGTYKSQLQQLNTVINSHGASTGNTAADPQLASYNTQLSQLEAQQTKWIGLKATYYNDFICQKYGGSQCPKKGVGPAAEASYQSYQQAAQQVSTLQGEITQVRSNIATRDAQLNSGSAAAQQARYQEAVAEKPLVQAEYNTAVQRQNQLQAVYFTQEQANHGILIRLEALSQLSDNNFTVSAARLLLFLLFLVIECLPVTVKLLQRPGLYEEALLYARHAEQAHVQRFYRNWAGPGRPAQADAEAPATVRGHVELNARNAVLDLWTPTRALPRGLGDPEDERGTDAFGYQPGYQPGYQGQVGDGAQGSRADSLDADRQSQFPPSEAEPRPARGWGRSASGGRPADRQPGDLGWAAPAAGSWAAQTLPDVQGPAATPDGGQSEHDALAGMADEPVSARSDGHGIALSWDDDE